MIKLCELGSEILLHSFPLIFFFQYQNFFSALYEDWLLAPLLFTISVLYFVRLEGCLHMEKLVPLTFV